MKRRIINQDRLKIFAKLLKPGGMIHFATDITDYASSVLKLFKSVGNYEPVNNPCIPHEYYVQTKYHLKAQSEGREARFYSWIIDNLYI
jgi:tRNA (guanine-N7-)-methyltransferase